MLAELVTRLSLLSTAHPLKFPNTRSCYTMVHPMLLSLISEAQARHPAKLTIEVMAEQLSELLEAAYEDRTQRNPPNCKPL
jgi:threonine synthase